MNFTDDSPPPVIYWIALNPDGEMTGNGKYRGGFGSPSVLYGILRHVLERGDKITLSYLRPDVYPKKAGT